MPRIALFLFTALGLSIVSLGCKAESPKTVNSVNCGLKTDDWCPALVGDPCGRHKNVAECKADPKCGGMPYRGESAVACQFDARGFGLNCPTVGCQHLTPTSPAPQNSR